MDLVVTMCSTLLSQTLQGGWHEAVSTCWSCPALLSTLLTGVDSTVELLVCPDQNKAELLQQQLSSSVSAVLAAAVRGGSRSRNLLAHVCNDVNSCLLAQ